jgi:hypothetical protein
MADYKTLLIKNKRLMILALSLMLVLSLYFIIWHYTGLRIIGSHGVMDVPYRFMELALIYLIISVFLSSLILAVMLAVKRKLIKKIFIAIILFFFLVSEIIRMIDWGALYFGGNHVDSNFWAHAFYADGFVFLATKTAVLLYIATAFFFAALFYILKQLLLLTGSEERL